jgi:hypothetical protein
MVIDFVFLRSDAGSNFERYIKSNVYWSLFELYLIKKKCFY